MDGDPATNTTRRRRDLVAAFVVLHLVAVVVLSLPYNVKRTSGAARAYSRVVATVRRVPAVYGQVFGVRQGWRMFGHVRTEVARFEIDRRVDGRWEPLYRPQSAEHDWQARLLRQERVRAALHGHGQQRGRESFEHLVAALVERARADGIDGELVRFHFRNVTIPPPDELAKTGELREGDVFWGLKFPLRPGTAP